MHCPHALQTVDIYTHTQTYIHTYIHTLPSRTANSGYTHTYTNIHTHIHTYIHTVNQSSTNAQPCVSRALQTVVGVFTQVMPNLSTN